MLFGDFHVSVYYIVYQKKENPMNKCCGKNKCDARIETEVSCKATASVEAEVQKELKETEDKPIEDLLNEEDSQ